MSEGGAEKLGWPDVLMNAPADASILVVDDDPEIQQMVRRLLVKFGYSSVTTAGSSEEADQWLTSRRFDAMILDCELPRMSGPEFLGWALKRDPEMVVIMLSGVDRSDVAVQCIESGARTYLVKPPDAHFFRLAVRDALAVRRVLVERNALAAGGGA